MTASTPHCEGCGSALPSADAVCARCEAELSTQTREPMGRYVCPCCDQRFASPAQALWPPKVPWWRPTTMRLQCPHCDTPLRDRHARPLPGWMALVAIAGAIGAQLFTTGWTRMLLGLSLISLMYAPLILAAWRSRQDVANPHRYVVGTTRFWAQGNDDLARAVARVRQAGDKGPAP